ncbi:MAG: methionyl-tRNA formyltransferase [Defluviitaleaceae bacterium]|nr:methionyl-tRNA formyltransferase [Defluviitaleaceae bacterium]MCL2835682.1 methionyl-tRNA formyltransferase [Defluviitaleaceae bacterium]
MNGLNIVFFGAPEFAAASLAALIKSKHKITAVVSQPDRPKGRSGKPVPTPVSVLAENAGIPILRPEKVRDNDFIAELSQIPADIFIVAAYGQFLNRKLLEMARFGAVNVHASLLPKYRGASPVASAIINGEIKTGVSIMQMERGMDTGPVLHSLEIEIDRGDTCGSLTEKLAVLGGTALLDALDLIAAGCAVPVAQNNSEVTYAPLLTKEMGLLDFNKPALAIYNQVRGLDPWPGSHIELDGRMLKVWRADIGSERHTLPPGTVISAASGMISIACGNCETIDLKEVQTPGGKRLTVSEYIKGNPIIAGGTPALPEL